MVWTHPGKSCEWWSACWLHMRIPWGTRESYYSGSTQTNEVRISESRMCFFFLSFFFFFSIYLFIWLHWVLVVAHGIFASVYSLFSSWTWAPEDVDIVAPVERGILVPRPGTEHVGRQILNHWATKEVPESRS